MTLPFENDTRIIVKKLAKRNLKADKSRNILIIITIALATCLIMTISGRSNTGIVIRIFEMSEHCNISRTFMIYNYVLTPNRRQRP